MQPGNRCAWEDELEGGDAHASEQTGKNKIVGRVWQTR